MNKAIVFLGVFVACRTQAAVVSIDIPSVDFSTSGPQFHYSYSSYDSTTNIGETEYSRADMSVFLNLDTPISASSTPNKTVYNNIVVGGSIEVKFEDVVTNYTDESITVIGSLNKTFRFFENLPSKLEINSYGTEFFSATAMADTGELAIWRATLPESLDPHTNLSLNALFLDPIKNGGWQLGFGLQGGYGMRTSIEIIDYPMAKLGWNSHQVEDSFKAHIVTEGAYVSPLATPIPGALYLLPGGLLCLVATQKRRKAKK